MKKTLLVFIGFILFQFIAKAQAVKDLAVMAEAVVTKSPAAITLKWPKITSGVTQYQVYRKGKNDPTWGSMKVSLANTDTTWTDTDVEVGKLYEYSIHKHNGSQLVGISYVLSGIEFPVVHNRGAMLVIVEKNLANDVSNELDAYLKELAADGWKVFAVQVSKTDSVQFVKREIKRFDKMAGGLKALLLLGHVPVPYSGNYGKDSYYTVPPDGHPDHSGCWPADTYYAIDFDLWADSEDNSTGISRNENKNLPGDGKFDNITIPGFVKFYMGRVDLSNMPKFGKTEAELTKQYFQKAHNYRYGITVTTGKAVIDENFGVSTGAFTSTGWRNFSAMFGAKNIIEDDYFTSCATQNLMFGFGSGGGSYTSCGGVGTTDDFVTKKPAVFNMLFGSYFGDWDITDNFLRAPLAAAENGLTSAWSGRPYWQNHVMAMGDPIGACAQITQNNSSTYAFNVFENNVHINLMGDPTLRLNIVTPPTNVNCSGTNGNKSVSISWSASTESGIQGYYIYRASSPYGNYFPLNSTPQTQTTFTDNAPFQGTNYYLIKTAKLTTTASGSYFNTSVGAMGSVSGITGQAAGLDKLPQTNLTIFPNPAKDVILVKFETYQPNYKIEIYDLNGKLVKESKIELSGDLLSNPFDISGLPKGLYVLKANNSVGRFMVD